MLGVESRLSWPLYDISMGPDISIGEDGLVLVVDETFRSWVKGLTKSFNFGWLSKSWAWTSSKGFAFSWEEVKLELEEALDCLWRVKWARCIWRAIIHSSYWTNLQFSERIPWCHFGLLGCIVSQDSPLYMEPNERHLDSNCTTQPLRPKLNLYYQPESTSHPHGPSNSNQAFICAQYIDTGVWASQTIRCPDLRLGDFPRITKTMLLIRDLIVFHW